MGPQFISIKYFRRQKSIVWRQLLNTGYSFVLLWLMKQLPFIFSDQWKYRIQRHLAFWIFWIIFQGFLYSFVAINSRTAYFIRLPLAMLESLVFAGAHIFLAYSLIYFVIPKFLLRQKYWQTSFWTLACFFLTAVISAVLNILVVDPLRVSVIGAEYANNPYRLASINFHLSLLAGLRGGLTIGGIAAAIKLMKYWYIKEQKNLQLQKENMEAQMQLLKAQIHPHFLFNTLNNIYSYTQNTSPVASSMVSRLSHLLRFVLYEANQAFVTLEKELKLIRDYIDLEKGRYGNKLELDIHIPGETNGLYIAPLLLLPLVENSFKHGTSQMLDQPWISLHIELQDSQLKVKLMNAKANNRNATKDVAGIGIENVKKRLELLYPGKHEMLITDDDEIFVVNLKIELESKEEPGLKILERSPVHA